MTMIKGKRAVLEALKTGQPVTRVYVANGSQDHPDIQLIVSHATQVGALVSHMTQSQLDALVKESNTQGVVATITTKKDMLLSELVQKQHPMLVVLDHLEDPFNFGAIMRSAEQFGARGIIYPKDRNATLTPGVIKASSGAIHYLDLVRVANIGNAIDHLKREGYWIVGTTVSDGEALESWEPNYPVAVVVGNEQRGLSHRIMKQCDTLVTIKTRGQLDSLNVSVATGILLHHMMCHVDGVSGDA